MKDRKVGAEAARTYQHKLNSGFFDDYMRGNGLDVGYAGYLDKETETILPTAIGIDKPFPNYDGIILPFLDHSQDYVYSSHCLEHISDPLTTLQEWHRVLKVGGFMVVIVPHQYLYEKKANLPSKFAGMEHKRFYTPASLMAEVEYALKPNSYRVRRLEDGDMEFDYRRGPDLHSDGQYEITLVLEKIPSPSWDLA